MRALVAAALVLAGCGPLTPVTDAGSGGGGGFSLLGGGGGSTGGGSGGGTTGGGGGALGGGGGAMGGGGGAMGGGGGAMGGGGGSPVDAGTTWQFAIMSLSPAPANSGNIVGFGETDAGVWAVSSSGRVYRSTGGPFTEQAQLTGLQPLDFEVASDGHMFIATTVRFYECASNCGTATSWNEHSLAASAFSLSTLCVVDSGHVLAIGAQGSGNDGISFRWNGTTIAGGPSNISLVSPRSCWKGNGGEFFIAGTDGVVNYTPSAQSFTPEMSMTANSWRGGGSVPGKDFVCGGSNRIAERGTGQWADVFTPSANSGAIVAIIGLSATEAFGFGGGFSSAGQAAYSWDGTTWRALNPDVPAALAAATSAFLASDGSIFVGGYDNSGNQYPVILRGRRR